MLRHILEDIGFTATEARNGREALERMTDTTGVELVLVDWNMPELDGLSFIRHVRSQPVYNDVVLVMVTSQSNRSVMEDALQAGANGYIMKPFTKEQIHDHIVSLGFETR